MTPKTTVPFVLLVGLGACAGPCLSPSLINGSPAPDPTPGAGVPEPSDFSEVPAPAPSPPTFAKGREAVWRVPMSNGADGCGARQQGAVFGLYAAADPDPERFDAGRSCPEKMQSREETTGDAARPIGLVSGLPLDLPLPIDLSQGPLIAFDLSGPSCDAFGNRRAPGVALTSPLFRIRLGDPATGGGDS